MRRCESPTASARSASASHATARDSGGPRRRPAAAAANCSSATAVRPSAKATRPAASCASGWSGEERSDNSRTHRWASRSKAAVAGPAWTPAAHPRQLGMCPPPTPALPIEEPTRLGGPGMRRGRFAGGQRAPGCSEQQFGPLGRPTVDLVQLADRRLGFLHRVLEQPCRRQRGAPADAQIRFDGTKTLESLLGLIEAAQRLRQVAEPQSEQPAVHGDLACFQFLAVRVEQVLGSSEIRDGALR